MIFMNAYKIKNYVQNKINVEKDIMVLYAKIAIFKMDFTIFKIQYAKNVQIQDG